MKKPVSLPAAVCAAAILSVGAVQAAQTPLPGGQTGARIGVPGQGIQPAPTATGAILGTVISASNGQPIDRVRLRLSGAELRGSRTIYSDDDGRFAFVNIPAGTFTLSASKTGYVSITYGQERPNAGRPGTPIELLAGQVLKDLTFNLPPGGVITGIVFDEKNRPSVATPVRVMRWSISSGERTLSSAGTSTTDDRGIYRVYGLSPGDYLVSAMPRNVLNTESVEMAMAVAEERMAELNIQGGSVVGNFSFTTEAPLELHDADEPSLGYAPVYYPGTLDLSTASTVTIGVSEERPSVDFALLPVPLAKVDGTVIIPPGVNLSSVQVRLYNVADRVPGVSTYSARARNGEFSFPGVPPGQYRAVATATVRAERPTPTPTADGRMVVTMTSNSSTSDRMWATSEVTVSGSNVANVTLMLQPGLTVSGRVSFEGVGAPPTNLRRVRITLSPFGQDASAAGATSRNANVDDNGNFTITGVVPANYSVRASGAGGWSLKSATVGGRDAMDFSLEVTPVEDVSGLAVAFTDQSTSVTGVLQDSMGSPTANFTVVVFPTDRRYWVPQSRRITTTRPSTTGQFSFNGLPPGDYRLAAVSDVEPGIWYDPAFLQQLAGASVPFSLSPGQSARQDLRVGR
jgi:uncharacterized protein (DUF2141 family)